MARICDYCHRGTTTAVSRSHSNIATKRRKFVNLQKRTINGRKLNLCVSCLKSATKSQTK